MTKRLHHIAPLQCGIVMAVLYGIMSLLFVPFVALAIALGPKSGDHNAGMMAGGAGLLLIVIVPIAYAVLGFIGGIIMAAVYNLVAKFTGGLEFTFIDAPHAAQLPA